MQAAPRAASRSLRAAAPCLFSSRGLCTTSRCLATAPPELLSLSALDTDAHHALARSWLDGFVLDDIPKTAFEVSYARSSGPGGQHVNKTNSKAVVYCNIHKARSWLPAFVVPELQRSPHYHSPNLLVSSQTSRSAPQNLSAALGIVHETIVKAGRGLIRGETTAEQKQRVAGLARIEQQRNRDIKTKLKAKKASRRKDW